MDGGGDSARPLWCVLLFCSRSAAKYHCEPQAGERRGGGVGAGADYSAGEVVDLLKRKPNRWDDNEAPLATDAAQSIHALFVISD